ncbi:unnamed protein product [Brassicogethes aeneus]|uniref:Transposase domain-containing protein n=1 Tax=Brassicogethes aeneus TaxID=1431903 RepID=A0A9P0FJB3_BRAAE|nr:unnamed protein product [Brassicogethes aeneus]
MGRTKKISITKRHLRRLVKRERELTTLKQTGINKTFPLSQHVVSDNSVDRGLDEISDPQEANSSTETVENPGFTTQYPVYQYLEFSGLYNTCNTDEEYVKSLRNWFLKFRHLMSESSMNDLLKILKSKCELLPSDSRTFLKTPHTFQFPIRDVSPGKYCHFGLQYMLQKQLNRQDTINLWHSGEKCVILRISVNIDGLPLSKSSTSQFWPILVAIDSTNKNFSKPFAVGMYHGYKKPVHISEYLESFVMELKRLETDGFTLKEVTVKVKISKLICDAPAKSFILSIKGHTGYFSCTKCIQEGDYVNGRMTFPETTSQLRTDEDFKNKLCEDFHKGVSPMEQLTIGLVSQVPLDYMHLVCLGVMKRLMSFWVRGNRAVRLSEEKLNKIAGTLCHIKAYVPKEFSRLPRDLREMEHFKATEFRLFLLYTGPIILQDTISKTFYMHFMSLHVAIRILCSEHLHISYNNYAFQLLKYFVEKFSSIYGSEYITHNIHGLIHLPQDCIYHGPLDNFSAFKFENYLYTIKRILKTSKHPLQQMGNRIKEQESFFAPSSQEEYPKLRYEIEVSLKGYQEHTFYKRLEFEMFQLSTCQRDNCVLLNDGNIIFVNYICVKNASQDMFLIGTKSLEHNPIYDNPCSSSLFGMVKVIRTSTQNEKYKIKEIKQKCFSFPVMDGTGEEWAVVNFVEDEKVSVVPSSWLNYTEDAVSCYWPPKNAGKHIKNHTKPEITWEKWKISILKQTNSYVEAREFVKLVSEAEDVTNTDIHGNQSFGRGQRKRKLPVHFNNNWDEQEDVEENDYAESFAMTPPPYLSCDVQTASKTTIPAEVPTRLLARSSINKTTTIVRTVSSELDTVITSVAEHNNIGNMTERECRSDNVFSVPRNFEDSPIIKHISNQLGVIKELVQRLVDAENRREAGNGNMNNSITNFELVPKKQFLKYRKLVLFDEDIKNNQEAERQNETALYLLGGASYKEHIRRGLRKLFSDRLAIKCSWTGRKNNFPLQHLKILELLRTATRKKFGQLTDAEYQQEVALWFRQAQLRWDLLKCFRETLLR